MSGNRFESWRDLSATCAKVAMLLLMFIVGVSGAWLPPGALRVSPESYTVLRTSGNSTLYQINLPANAELEKGGGRNAKPEQVAASSVQRVRAHRL